LFERAIQTDGSASHHPWGCVPTGTFQETSRMDVETCGILKLCQGGREVKRLWIEVNKQLS